MTQSPPSRTAIVGAGFSGLLTALHLLDAPTGMQVTLIERRAAFGPGRAYDTGNPHHLLNVRLGNMSAYPNDPDHLVRWLSEQPSWEASGAFITRGAYGDYLKSLLDEALSTHGDRLTLIQGDVVDLERAGDEWRLTLWTGETVTADTVVLALGNQEPQTPGNLGEGVRASGRYVTDPWSADLSDRADVQSVLLMGSGLTMVDVAVALRRPGRRLTAISRHGLLPRAHASVHTPAADITFSGPPSAVMAQAREAARRTDWRAVFDALRAQARGLWADWSQAQRRRFIRHLRPLWDVHRHRLAPSMAREISHMLAGGELTVAAGKIADLSLKQGRIRATWRPRGKSTPTSESFDLVVNCTGPIGEVRHSRDPLICRLLERRLVTPDPLGLGFAVDVRGRALGPDGAPHPGLVVVGPLSRGAFWEMTSVPDLRVQARDTAHDIRRG